MSEKLLIRAWSHRSNRSPIKSGERKNIEIQFGGLSETRSLKEIDSKLLDYLFSEPTKHDPLEVHEFVANIVNKRDFCRKSPDRIYLTLEILKKFDFVEMLEDAVKYIKSYIKNCICTHSQKVKEIFIVLKKANFDVKKFIEEIEDDFKFIPHVKLAYRLAKI